MYGHVRSLQFESAKLSKHPEPALATPLLIAFAQHRDAVERFVRARLGSEASEIDDLMQEVWLRAAKIGPNPIADHRSYLFRLAHNLVLERHRKLWRGRRRDADWMDGNVPGSADQPEPTAERSLIAQDELAMVETALRGVGDRAYRILRRFRLDEISQLQIAEEFGVSLSTVEKELRKAYDALAALKRRLDED